MLRHLRFVFHSVLHFLGISYIFLTPCDLENSWNPRFTERKLYNYTIQVLVLKSDLCPLLDKHSQLQILQEAPNPARMEKTTPKPKTLVQGRRVGHSARCPSYEQSWVPRDKITSVWNKKLHGFLYVYRPKSQADSLSTQGCHCHFNTTLLVLPTAQSPWERSLGWGGLWDCTFPAGYRMHLLRAPA